MATQADEIVQPQIISLVWEDLMNYYIYYIIMTFLYLVEYETESNLSVNKKKDERLLRFAFISQVSTL